MKTLMFCEQEHGDSILKTWLPAAIEARRRGWKVYFLCSELCTDDYLASLSTHGIDVVRTVGYTKTVNESWGTSKPMHWLRRLLKLSDVCTFFWNFTAFKKSLVKLFQEKQVTCIVVVADGFHFRNNIYAAAARRLGIASVCLPTSYGGLANLFIHTRSFPPGSEKLRKPRILDAIARKVFRDQYVFSAFGYEAVPWRAAEHLAGLACGIRPPVPTCRAGGQSDSVLAPSEFARDVLVREGVPFEKTKVVGSPSFDELAGFAGNAEHRSSLRAELGCAEDAVLVVWNMINFSGYGLLSESAEQQMIEAVYEQLAQLKRVRLVISMHPGKCGPMFTSLAEKYGAVFARNHGVNALIAAADVYLTPISTTITSAGLLSIPTVVLAWVTEIENPTYVKAHQILRERHLLVAADSQELGEHVSKLLGREARAEISGKMQENASIWGALDGGSSRRIADEIDALTGKGMGRDHPGVQHAPLR